MIMCTYIGIQPFRENNTYHALGVQACFCGRSHFEIWYTGLKLGPTVDRLHQFAFWTAAILPAGDGGMAPVEYLRALSEVQMGGVI